MLTAIENWAETQTPPPLRPGHVHLWRARLNPRPQMSDMLSPSEWMRAGRYHFACDRERYIATRRIVRSILSRYLNVEPRAVEFDTGHYGKPMIAGSDTTLRFNLSHSDDLLLLAVTHAREVGVDLEFMRQDLPFETLADHYFEADEAWELRQLPSTQRAWKFYDVWTATEAQLKASGVGFMHGTTVPGRDRWSLLKLAPALGYAAAVAVEGAEVQVECCSWPG